MLRTAAQFDTWASAWSCLFACGAMLASAIGRSITWRGISYYIGPAGRITLLGRVPDAQQYREMTAVHLARLDRDKEAVAANTENHKEAA
jgi:hypothetical protein